MNRALPFLALGLILLGSPGCVSDDQLGQVRAFSAAASAYATQAGDAFARVNDLSVERKLSEVALHAQPLEETAFTGVLDGDERMAIRLNALAALGAYASALEGLATADNRQAVDQASTALYGALVRTRAGCQTLTGHPGLSDAELGVVATAVDALGRAVTEKLRADAIRTVVIRADPAIQALGTGLAADFRASADSFKAMTDSIYTDQYVAFRRAGTTLGYDAALARLRALRTAYQCRAHAGDFLEELSQASLALARAHAAVRDSLVHPDRSPAELLKTIGQLKMHADALRAFDASLTSTAS